MKIYIADILRKAADEFLWDGRKSDPFCESSCEFSCNSIEDCIDSMTDIKNKKGFTKKLIQKGLREMGLSVLSAKQFNEFSNIEERQAARYNWLYFAALIAEEQGAFVEISD